ncbi:LANO_0H07184g1_1 [Lachancea nothofagi CBS 11611]|uniref:LANO_0H07184g1_1 n=1 Tax=Lachancea nothofagi CBS 11611 TaxID=1266666 RepID=A0A1G4KLZ6_9SACH|nr:LANO_0H07184g1_1 [Lachancea nothofagi CBS 11611]
MDTFKHVSRSELYGEQTAEPSSDSGDLQLPDFEFVSVTKDDTGSSADPTKAAEIEDEFDFPLFSFGVSEAPEDHSENKKLENDGSRGRSATRLIKVSLREPSPDIISQERPRSYYFAEHTPEQTAEFEKIAIDYNLATKESRLTPSSRWPEYRGRLLDARKYNEQFELERLREIKIRRRKPGKKQRKAKQIGAQRELERLERAKELKKLAKKKFHKRGGKKNKKPVESTAKA